MEGVTDGMADFALVIGIENYLTANIPAVRFAEADANGMVEALSELGFNIDCVLLSEKATKTMMEHKITELFESLQPDDRILFYYAGHGFAEVGNTILSCSDSILKKIGDTGIRVSWILERLNESLCDQAMFFFDACHAGSTDLKTDRSVLDTMSESELKTFFAKAEHKVCFAACKFNQTSVPSGKLKHGVWTHYVLKALRGEVKIALEKGRFLTASGLQNYLQKEVPLAAQAARTTEHKQTPIMYGAQSGDFCVADLKPILDKKDLAEAKDPVIVTAVFRATEKVSVKDLSGFERGHRVPDQVAQFAENFIQRIASKDVHGRIEAWAQKIRSSLKLKRAEIKIEDDRIITKDFEFAIWCEQSKTDPGEAIFYEELSKVSAAIRTHAAFEGLFADSFDRMVVTPPKTIDVEHVIDTLEALDTDHIELKYPTDAKRCTIRITGSGVKLVVTKDEVRVISDEVASPNELADAFFDTGNELKQIAGKPVLLLN